VTLRTSPHHDGFTCPVCGRFIVTAVVGLYRDISVGSPRRFCDAACRQAAYRRRRAGVAEDTPRQTRGGRDRALTGPTPMTDKEATNEPDQQ
jgi:hypothetical protein